MTMDDSEVTVDMKIGLVCQEQYGSTQEKHSFVVKEGKDELEEISKFSSYTSLEQVFRSVFLPQGYPESVSEDYLAYQIWDTVQAFASSITRSLAAHAVLKGVGVGDETATVLGATITWLLKDEAGKVGQIAFAWAKGTGLDCDAKRWRLFADVMNDISTFLNILAPLFGPYFTLVICISGICNNIVGVAGKATRAALTQHQARRDNMADVFAKDGSQETMVSLTGLFCSLIIVPLVSGNQALIWLCFVLLTCLHLLANYKAVTAVCMESINQARLHFIVKHFLAKDEVLGVKEVNFKEPVVFPLKRRLKIHLGASMSAVRKRGAPFSVLKNVYEKTKAGYLLWVDFYKGHIDIVLHHNSTKADQLQACVHAELIIFLMERTKKRQELRLELQKLGKLTRDCSTSATQDTDLLSCLLKDSLHFTQISMSSLTQRLKEVGWNTDMCLLGADEWRASWDFQN